MTMGQYRAILRKLPALYMPHSTSITDTERLARLHFHVKTGDYFPMLATILGFIEETLDTYPGLSDSLPILEKDLIQGVRKDLMYLHEYYQIEVKMQDA
ncbi:MAG: hypothetical protein JWO58_3348 [Chitinophagaceae bacterium]|nr:hypothetical protein [Chitinophagaceae bacterium]